MYNVNSFIDHLVEETRQYLFDLRGEYIEYKVWFDEDEMVYKCQFSYGRIGEGSEIQAILAGIANVLTAVHEDGL